MKHLYYVRLFFFIAFNWNIRLAWFTVYHEIRGEKKYRLTSTKIEDTKKLTIKGVNAGHAELYQGANYYLLEKVFEHLQPNDANLPALQPGLNLLDFGCGKGRVLAVAANYGFDKITGVEFAKELCEAARKNIIPVQQQFPAKIFNVIHADAVDHNIEDDTNVFFFFNPFDEVVMLSVAKNILKSLKKTPREAYVIYINPIHKEIFMSAGFEEIFYYEKLKYIQASIFMVNADDQAEEADQTGYF